MLPWYAEKEQDDPKTKFPYARTSACAQPRPGVTDGPHTRIFDRQMRILSSIGIWPKKDVLDPELWLRNFCPDELDHALYLLNAFMYFATDLVDQVFSTSIRTIGRLMTGDQWARFLGNVLVTPVTGEEPNVTDSGNVFARKARSFGIHRAA